MSPKIRLRQVSKSFLTQHGADAAFVFQSFRLLPWRTVLGNVWFPLELRGVERRSALERARAYVRLVGLDGLEQRYPHELSGGMQQRVGLARALAAESDILLMDEPFGALDAQTRQVLQIELSQIFAERKPTIVFVTHSLDEALFLGDRIVLMRAGPGEVDEVLDVNLARPRWEYDVQAEPEYRRLRAHLWGKIQRMVGDQPRPGPTRRA